MGNTPSSPSPSHPPATTTTTTFDYPSAPSAAALRDLAHSHHLQKQQILTSPTLSPTTRSTKLHHLSKSITETNWQASQQIFQSNNPSLFNSSNNEFIVTKPLHNEFKIDLHGLFVKEALAYLKAYISLLLPFAYENSLQNHSLIIIVGKGNHSKDSGPKLGPAVRGYFENGFLEEFFPGKWREFTEAFYDPARPNEGCVMVFLDAVMEFYEVEMGYERNLRWKRGCMRVGKGVWWCVKWIGIAIWGVVKVLGMAVMWLCGGKSGNKKGKNKRRGKVRQFH